MAFVSGGATEYTNPRFWLSILIIALVVCNMACWSFVSSGLVRHRWRVMFLRRLRRFPPKNYKGLCIFSAISLELFHFIPPHARSTSPFLQNLRRHLLGEILSPSSRSLPGLNFVIQVLITPPCRLSKVCKDLCASNVDRMFSMSLISCAFVIARANSSSFPVSAVRTPSLRTTLLIRTTPC